MGRNRLWYATLLAAIVSNAIAGAHAQPADEAEQRYQAFKEKYRSAQTADELRAALPLVEKAFELQPTGYRYAFGIGATHERLAEFAPCEKWFEIAVGLADEDVRRTKANVHREYCQNELDKLAVTNRAPTIRISFATKLSFAHRELDAGNLPRVFPEALDADPAALVAEVARRVPPDMDVASYDHYVIAAPHSAIREGERIAEFDAQIRRRFFPDLPKRRLILILGDEPFELRRIAENLFPGVAIPNAPFFGFYRRQDRLIMATALGGYGTVLHELMHALVQDDFQGVPLWLEEGMATLYERSAWSTEKLIPVPNWRMDLITPEQTLADDAFSGIGGSGPVAADKLSLIRLLFSYLDQNGRLAALYAEVKQRGPQTTLAEALQAVMFEPERWRIFAERSFREYAVETSHASGGGLTNPGEIKYVQRALNATIGAGLKPDGLWGSNTEKAVRQFQQRFGLEVDGMVGRNTLIVLRREYGERSLE